MRVLQSRLVPLIFLSLAPAAPAAIAAPVAPAAGVVAGGTAAPATKGPEVRTTGQGPGTLTPLEIAKLEALVRAFPNLGIRIPVSYAPQGSFQAPTVRIEHFAAGAPRGELSTRAPSVGPRDRTKASGQRVVQVSTTTGASAGIAGPSPNGAPQVQKGDRP